MKKPLNITNKRLKNLINNSILITLIEQGFDIEFILYIYKR